ncbi:alanine--tRNA ligase [Texas Phoenix palm phytoplasma]|uniref:Alanine--tRNA ligase n=1 Tax=Texas Phoenix palm phytoplasma TaxID=176709 RepID=A0ABS5BHW0_9MOLU|nr:alanine--tRNA ligase [Texas Phoenix palm phytoplasma]MBP3059183.1 alanine--tRNA ligase [Texas Phoenix palm phytoplasma]
MKKLTSHEIRKMWLEFFIKKQHYKIESSSLIPESDRNLLWINAGVTPLKKYFDGSEIPPFSKIVNIQRCLRMNDIENIGKTPVHHTFFEMLGNFSIGDYFKKESINLAYELLFSSEYFNFPKEKIYFTYFYKDFETYNYWLKKNINVEHLIPLKNNFWQIGEGPCGPCTEIFFDRGEKYDSRGKELIINDISNKRFIEIWNIVFSQYNCELNVSRDKLNELPNKNIDTGAGLERISCILQKTDTSFETDLFFPIISEISQLSGQKYKGQEIFKIIADHIKTLVFGIADGVVLSNVGRGYVLKKILRRALQNSDLLFSKRKPFLFKLVKVVIETMEESYPFLKTKRFLIENIIKNEEEKFLINLKLGKEHFLKLVNNNTISSENFFKLYDTFGLPKDVIFQYAKQHNVLIEDKKFDFFLDKQKQLSRKRTNINSNMQKQNPIFLNFKEKSEFIGYELFSIKTKIIKIFEQGIVLQKTPFFPIMGGQNSDEGMIDNIFVNKVIKLPNGQIFHYCSTLGFTEGQEVLACIDTKTRQKHSINHTSTHLLCESLKKILGFHVEQQGSFIGNKIFRFDFNHFKNLSFEEICKIEEQVNKWINADYPVKIKNISFQDAKKNNLFSFENKIYDEKNLRLVQISDISKQLCGGTHVSNTKKLHKFVILNCTSIGSGIYRIEATSGDNLLSIIEENIEYFFSEEKKILYKINQLEKNIVGDIFLNLDKKPFFLNTIIDSFQNIQKYKNYINELKKYSDELQKKIFKQQEKDILKEYINFIPYKFTKKELIIIDNKILPVNLLKVLLKQLFYKMKIDFLCLLCKQNEDKFVFLCQSNNIDVSLFIKNAKSYLNICGGGNKNFGQGNICNSRKKNIFVEKWKTFL